MNAIVFRALRHFACKRTMASIISIRPKYVPLLSSQRHFASGNDDDASDSKTGGKKDVGKAVNQQPIDVTEYYSQYIKEYEQGGFKDDNTGVEWEVKREKLHFHLGRGETGVMDVEEVVEFLRAERVKDVCTIRMPNKLAYAPFMVIGTPLGRRHLNALSLKMNEAYKKKRALYDPPSMRIEGDENPEWRVFDLGNVVVHLMMPAARNRYDIEMLWTVGPDNDDLTNSFGELDQYEDRLKQLQQDVDWLSNTKQESVTQQV